MARKADLLKVGMEGFGMLDEYYGRKGRNNIGAPEHQSCKNQYTPQQPYVYQMNPVSATKEMVLDCYDYEAPPKLFKYQYQPQQPYVYQVTTVSATKETVLESYEAAKLYGGAVIVDYPKRKSMRLPF